jgi:hypothetical protein
MTAQPQAIPPTLDPATFQDTLLAVFGAQPLNPNWTGEQHATRRGAAAALIIACAPEDPIQAAHAARFAAAHYGSMECFRRATLPDMPEALASRWYGRAVGLGRMAEGTLALLKQCQAAAAFERTRPALAPAAAAPRPQATPEPAQPAAATPVGRQDPMPSERAPVQAAAAPILARPATGNPASVAPPQQAGRAALLNSTSPAAVLPAGMKMPPFQPAAPRRDATSHVA